MDRPPGSEQAGVCLAAGDVDTSTLKAKDVMRYGVVSIGKDEPVCKAVKLLLEKQISGLPVTHEGRLEGVLSEKDILKLLYEKEYLPGCVGDYATRNVVTFDIEDRFSDIFECLVKSVYRRVPILHEGKLAGVISRSDLIRIYKERFRPATQSHAPGRYRDELLARDAMTHGLLTVRRDTSLYEVMDILSTNHVTGLPVVDQDMHLQGMITEKDILRSIRDTHAVGSTAQNHMTDKVVAFDQSARLWDVCACLITRPFRRVPILSQGRLVGILSRTDVIRKMTAVFKCSPADG